MQGEQSQEAFEQNSFTNNTGSFPEEREKNALLFSADL